MEPFHDTFVRSNLDDVWFATRGCPKCLEQPLQRVRADHEPRWLCGSCQQCWQVTDGVLRPVDPLSCAGCASRPKSECIALLQSTFPRFGAGARTDDDT